MRLIRTIVLLGGAAIFLPSPPADDMADASSSGPAPVSAVEMLTQAISAISDVTSFCQRQPGACETAIALATHLEAKARYNARLIYEWAAETDRPVGHAEVPVVVPGVDPIHTGSAARALRIPEPLRQSTLRPDDLIPAWRSPVTARGEG